MINTLNKINGFLTSKAMNLIDYIGAFLAILYTAYLFFSGQDYLIWAIASFIALVFAITKPAKYINEKYGNQNLKPKQ